MFRRITLTALLLLSAAHYVAAHDVWIDQRDGALVVLRGHGDKLESYNPANVKDAKAVDAAGQNVAVEIVKGTDGASLTPKGNPAIVAAVFDGGYWLKTTEGWKKTTKSEAKGKFQIVEAVKSRTCCKTVLTSGEASAKPVGQYFEIVPQKDPKTLRGGDSLPIKVLLDGKPLEGAEVGTGADHASGKKDALKTDKDGLASVTLKTSGPQLVKANHKVAVKDDPEADVLYLSSSVTFKVD